MMTFLGFIHPFGGQHVDDKIISDELIDECPRNSVVKALLCLSIDIEHLRVNFHK